MFALCSFILIVCTSHLLLLWRILNGRGLPNCLTELPSLKCLSSSLHSRDSHPFANVLRPYLSSIFSKLFISVSGFCFFFGLPNPKIVIYLKKKKMFYSFLHIFTSRVLMVIAILGHCAKNRPGKMELCLCFYLMLRLHTILLFRITMG